MSFYNPNIQSAFEADIHESIVLRNVILASYKMVFNIREGCLVTSVEDLRAVYQLEFLRIESAFQHQNFELVDSEFVFLFAEMALNVLIGKLSTFDEFLHFKVEYTPEMDRNKFLYLGDCILNYIELLIYSDIADNIQSSGDLDFTKLLGVRKYDSIFPVFNSLYDRLKLYIGLRKQIRFDIDRNFILLNGREVRFELKLRI